MEKKLESEDLEQLKSLQEEFTRVTIDMGKNEIDIINIEQQMENLRQKGFELKQKYRDLIEKQNTMNDKLADKYGDGSVDIESGIFKPFKQE